MGYDNFVERLQNIDHNKRITPKHGNFHIGSKEEALLFLDKNDYLTKKDDIFGQFEGLLERYWTKSVLREFKK